MVLVTKDILLRIKAQIIGIKAEDFQTEQVLGHEAQYRGRISVYVSEDHFRDFKKKGFRWKSYTRWMKMEKCGSTVV